MDLDRRNCNITEDGTGYVVAWNDEFMTENMGCCWTCRRFFRCRNNEFLWNELVKYGNGKVEVVYPAEEMFCLDDPMKRARKMIGQPVPT